MSGLHSGDGLVWQFQRRNDGNAVNRFERLRFSQILDSHREQAHQVVRIHYVVSTETVGGAYSYFGGSEWEREVTTSRYAAREAMMQQVLFEYRCD